MNKLHFSKSEAISFGWKKTKEHLGFFILLFVVVFGVSLFAAFLEEFLLIGVGVFGSMTGALITMGVNIIISMGFLNILLKIHDGKKAEIKDLFTCYTPFFSYLVASILYFMAVSLGLLLFIVPGIILMIKFWFFNYLIVDKNLGPVEALSKSYEITKGIKMNMFLFLAITGFIFFLGALAFFVGLLVAIPVASMAWVFVYRKLLSQMEESVAEVL